MCTHSPQGLTLNFEVAESREQIFCAVMQVFQLFSLSNYVNCIYRTYWDRQAWANSVDPDKVLQNA